ncbi:PREDICTED: mucin-19 [Fragaria vesca subsp. vesca]|uniref:mucin-19 n=1 Tax=Fragaria vesca subsp. vesca TaxID=101020 RepID=UPI0002C3388B|nr:PREDICTED: mucin-19 [Fragaria vesca subsp. vesca]
MNSNFDFDLGLGSNRPRSLNDQKNKTSSFSTPSQPPSKPAWQPNKTSWTHQPAPTQTTPLNGPTSMVGDIFGKSWASTAPSVSTTPIAVVNKNPNLFGDLVSSAMGGKVSTTNVPLKNATPASNKTSFSMGNVADSLPKSTAGASSGQSGINWGGSGSSGGYSSGINSTSKINSGVNASSSTKSPSLGGPSLRNMSGGGVGGGGIGSKKDPFGSLVDLASKPAVGIKTTASKGSNKSSIADDGFGDFQNAPKPSTASAFPAGGNSFMGSDPFSGFGDFGTPAKQNPVQSTSSDPLDMFFPTSSGSGAGSAAASSGVGVEQSSGIDDWGTEFGGGVDDMGGSTTELEGLPPPPAGVSASAAKSKGMDNYKQGQYPDAIKWLSWAVVLLEKAADRSALSDVLSSRASCYKEVGEYKKAVADCTKVLEKDDENVSVLVQRALLYESMEKYRLGAEDLRTVLRIDPGNRVARGTIHRLTQLAD